MNHSLTLTIITLLTILVGICLPSQVSPSPYSKVKAETPTSSHSTSQSQSDPKSNIFNSTFTLPSIGINSPSKKYSLPPYPSSFHLQLSHELSLLKSGVLTNAKRQRGNSSQNPISNLHKKVNGQGGMGGQELNVTDVSPSLQFRAPTPKPRRRLLSIALSPLPLGKKDLNLNLEEDTTNSGNANSYSPSDTRHSGDSKSTSLVIKKDLISPPNSFLLKAQGESSTSLDATQSRQIDMDTVSLPVTLPPSQFKNFKEANRNGDGDSVRYGLLKRGGGDGVNSSSGSGISGIDTIGLPETDPEGFSHGLKSLKGQEGGSCLPVVVNQTVVVNYTDLDKWTRTLVKISQCIANCVSNTYLQKYNMSPKKGINGMGGTSTGHFPVGISSPNYNRDITSFKNNLDDKLLSSCQKSCKFLPQKSPTFPPTSTIPKKNAIKEKETNKLDESWISVLNKLVLKPISLKAPKSGSDSSPSSNGVEITKSDTETGVFHLHWPKVKVTSSTNINTKMPTIYTVIFQDLDGDGEDPWWKLIDQTVAQQTQISLVAHVCQPMVPVQELKLGKSKSEILTKTITTSDIPPKLYLNQPKNQDPKLLKVSVLAIGSKGLKKLFSGLLTLPSACCQKSQKDMLLSQDLGRNVGELSSNSVQIPAGLGVNKNSNTNLSTNPRGTSKGKDYSKKAYKGENIPDVSPGASGESSESGSEKAIPDLQTQSEKSWGLRIVSMVYQNFLVVAELSWNFPGGPSNPVESVDSNSNNNGGNGSSRSESGSGGSNSQRYQFLLTWEIFGGGLKGNLVTDMTSGTISLWRDTAYFIQVGLIHRENSDSPFRSEEEGTGRKSEAKSSDVKLMEQHENYMTNTNLLGVESIIFPLADGEPKVTLASERLFVNTSQLPIPKSSPSSSQRTGGDSIKSNNPLLQREHQPLQSEKWGKSTNSRSELNVIPIVIPSATVSKNGNENDQRRQKKNEVDGGGHDHHFGHRHWPNFNKNDQLKDYMGDSPQANAKKVGDENGKGTVEVPVHSYHYYTSSRKNPTLSTPNGPEDKANINDNKNNNNLKHKKTTGRSSAKNHHRDTSYHPDAYQGLFSLNMGLGGYSYGSESQNSQDSHSQHSLDGSVTTDSEKFYSNSNGTNTNTKSNDTGASVVYSIFVLIVVACVIFLFLVAFIGFFVVTSSISNTAHYFIPKRIRIWIIGASSESELLAGESGYENDETEDADFDRRFCDADDLDDDGPEWEGSERRKPVLLTHRT